MLEHQPAITYKQPELPPDFDAWQALGVNQDVTTAAADSAWQELPEAERSADRHFAWKVLRDPAYAALYTATNNVQRLYDAGFFIDAVPLETVDALRHTEHDITTPYHAIQEQMKNVDYADGKPVVLVTTGGFSPIHWGHLSMMKTAKQALEEQGRAVVGGYISPSHDDYVGQKYGGSAKLSAPHRIYLAQQAVDQPEYRDWLMVDPWESQYAPTDVNFTDVIRHLQTYLQTFVDERGFDVMYVNGTDNAGFADVLKYMNGGVTVSRSTADGDRPAIFEQPEIAEDPRLLFVPSEDPSSEFSSASVRRWRPQLMPADVSKKYFGWRVGMMSRDTDITPPSTSYMIRDDGGWAMKQYFPEGPTFDAMQQIEHFKTGLSIAIKAAFADVETPDTPRTVDVHYLPLHEQQQLADALAAEQPVLNLDGCTNRDGGINFSRLFAIASGQEKPLDLVARPGFPDVETQIAGIAAGEYLLLDDDIASGATVNHLMGLLPDHIRITALQTLYNQSRRLHSEINQREVTDMVDLRDFMLGSYIGGLVVPSPDYSDIVRAPYMLPFVSSFSRAAIPLSSMRRFSQECWRLNGELFEGFADQGHQFTLGDASPEFQTLMLQLGFTPDTTVSSIARYYEQFLRRASAQSALH